MTSALRGEGVQTDIVSNLSKGGCMNLRIGQGYPISSSSHLTICSRSDKGASIYDVREGGGGTFKSRWA